MSAPIVPQRPSRSQNNSAEAPAATLDIPQVPPRPTRAVERSVSPNRIDATRSPLNDSPFASNIPPGGPTPKDSLTLQKLPSVSSLPLVGQEGMEYASLEQQQTQDSVPSISRPESPNETRNIAGDLPIHAPKATIGAAAATSQLAPVTRVDSAQAASSGIGKPRTEYEESELPSRVHEYRPPSASSHNLTRSLSRPNSSRPESFHSDEHDHGIPHIGLQVPIYPNAGDVQAPLTPSNQPSPSTGVGFFNAGVQTASGLHHTRRRSLQGGPPGSYGLHGHGVIHNDQFEKSWYQKHPEELTKEEKGAYGPSISANRSQWALSSDDLNKLVRDTANKHAHGTAPPDEDFGYKLSEEITSRQNSPQLRAVKSRTLSQTYAESPLRQASFPDDVHGAHAFDSENEDDLHLGPARTAGTPALAPDEQIKSPSAPGMQPAVSPMVEKSGDDDYFSSVYNHSPSHSRPGRSRPNSRPGSARFHHHEMETHGTPLPDVEEYEPLFNDDDAEGESSKRPVTAADKLKRPEIDRRRFPSLDVWEDTPTSLQLHTTVSGPQEPDEPAATASRAAPAFESPEKERARKLAAYESHRSRSYLDDENEKTNFKSKPGVEDYSSYRSNLARKFPSSDIWEDTPTSLQLVTTIDQEKAREEAEAAAAAAKSPPSSGVQEKPTIPARPARTKEVETTQAQPSVPPRPQRAKPQIPPRPVKTSQDEASEGSPLTKTTSAGSTGSPEVTSPTDRSVTGSKPKPAVPSKPAGSSKFASIKAGFMNDLNNRLQLGPQVKKPTPAESETSPEEEKAPLTDARKARARGPARRKPAEPSPSERSAPAATASKGWSIVTPMNTWSISNSDSDQVIVGAPTSRNQPEPYAAQEQEPASEPPAHEEPEPPSTQKETEPAPAAAAAAEPENTVHPQVLATNTAGEPIIQPTVDFPEHDPKKDARAAAADEATAEKLRPHFERQTTGAEVEGVEPVVVDAVAADETAQDTL